MMARLLRRVARWALSKNPPGGYAGEDDKRWAYVIETDGSPYLTRIMLPRITIPFVGSFRPMIHNFHRPDSDRNLHDHPWNSAVSFILSGSYDEERLDHECTELTGREVREYRIVRWFNTLTKDDFHAVTRLHGDVWTLFITGTNVQDWGFLADGVKVPWREYLGKS